MQQPRIADGPHGTLCNLCDGAGDTRAAYRTDKEPDSIRTLSFLKPGNNRTTVIIEDDRRMAEGVPGADSDQLAECGPSVA